MKNMKKLASLLLALIVVLAMVPTAFAADAGSITINSIQKNEANELTATYEIYKILTLESYDTTEKTYSYKVEDAWRDFFTGEDVRAYVDLQTEVDAENNEVIPEELYIKGWKGSDSDDRVAAFAKLALAYASEKGIVADRTIEKGTEISGDTLVFENLPLGYYLVDSTVGALCGLTTTNPNASITAKNGAPTIDKQVKEDSTEQWGGNNSADIGQTVEFRTTINVHAGAQNYVLHDKMSEGLTFKQVDKIELIVPGNETASRVLVEDTDYTIVSGEDIECEEDCTFEVHFTNTLCDELETNDKLIVSYSAMLNRNAIVAEDGNTNDTHLDYGEENETTHDSTTTKTYGFDIIKTDSQNTLIDGAKFRIYDAAVAGNEVAVVLMDDGVTYRRARADEEGVEIEVKDGKVRVVGFDNGTYYLEETVAPGGYNKLAARQKFIISDANLDAVFNENIFSTGSSVHVVNKSGTMLPETGGIGTTIFYVVGGLLVAAAVVLLVTRKRMSER